MKLKEYLIRINIIYFLFLIGVIASIPHLYFLLVQKHLPDIIFIVIGLLVFMLIFLRLPDKRLAIKVKSTTGKIRIIIFILCLILVLIGLKYKTIWTVPSFIIIPFIWEIVVKGRKLSTLGFTNNKYLESIASGIIIALFSAFFFYYTLKFKMALPTSNILRPGTIPYMIASYPLMSRVVFYTIYSFLKVGLPEEIFFRGFIQQKLERSIGIRSGVLVSAFIYAIAHYTFLKYWGIFAGSLFIIQTFFSGLILGLVFSETRNISSSWIGHSLMHLPIAITLGLF